MNLDYLDQGNYVIKNKKHQACLDFFKTIIRDKVIHIKYRSDKDSQIIKQNKLFQRILTLKCLHNDCVSISYYYGYCILHFDNIALQNDIEELINNYKSNINMCNTINTKQIIKKLNNSCIIFTLSTIYYYYINGLL